MSKDVNSTEQIPNYYGVRRRVDSDVHGQPLYDEVPLTLDDFLNPTDDDIFEVGPRHEQDVAQLFMGLQVHYRHNQLALVARNLKIIWDNVNLAQPRADILIATSDAPQTVLGNRFSETTWGGPPRCVIEVTAPRLADADLVDKVAIYEQGGVDEYIIVDSGLRENQTQIQYSVIGYRLDTGRYQPIEIDQNGRIVSEVCRLKIGLTSNGDGIELIDLRSGQPIDGEEVIAKDRIAQVQGNRRADEIGSALDFLRG
ncbi:MAG: Uma2 family endonuclease [Chloroflexota bacterium]